MTRRPLLGAVGLRLRLRLPDSANLYASNLDEKPQKYLHRINDAVTGMSWSLSLGSALLISRQKAMSNALDKVVADDPSPWVDVKCSSKESAGKEDRAEVAAPQQKATRSLGIGIVSAYNLPSNIDAVGNSPELAACAGEINGRKDP